MLTTLAFSSFLSTIQAMPVMNPHCSALLERFRLHAAMCITVSVHKIVQKST